MSRPIKFTDNNKTTLLLDNIFAVNEYLEYAVQHNMDVLFTETTFISAIEEIYKFVKVGYEVVFKEAEQISSTGTKLNPKIHVLLKRTKI